MTSPTRELDLCAIKIPSVAEAFGILKSEICNANVIFLRIQKTSHFIQNSNFVDEIAQHEATALNESAHNLELAVSEMQERMISLEVILSKNAIFPATLSTADDVSVAFNIAVNGSEIDWPLAEMVLERYVFLWTEEVVIVDDIVVGDNDFLITVWENNDFESNIVKLLKGGDCWRVRKSLDLIFGMVWPDKYTMSLSMEIFDSLAFIILEPTESSPQIGENSSIFLIAKNQKRAIDNDISRLINSFLYSHKKKISISYKALKIIREFVNSEPFPRNKSHFSNATNIPKALIKIFIEEKRNEYIIEVCLDLINTLISTCASRLQNSNKIKFRIMLTDFVTCGFCEALIFIMETHLYDDNKMCNILYIIFYSFSYGEQHIKNKFISVGLLKAVVHIFHSPLYDRYRYCVLDSPLYRRYRNCALYHILLVKVLCKDAEIIEQFHTLGIPEGSRFFGTGPLE
jgi:hypothetical protein